MKEQRTPPSEARERVVIAAQELFVQGGFTDVSMQQIAERASITKATLYHHFRDKHDLYLATMRRAFTLNYANFFDRIGKEPELRLLIRELLAYIVNGEQADLQRLMSDFRKHIDEETQQTFWDEFPKPWVALEPAVRQEMDAGHIIQKDPEFIARFIYGAVAGYAHVTRMSHDPDTIDDEFLDRFTNTVFNGISQR